MIVKYLIYSPGYEKVVENEGMPILEDFPKRGNLIIRFNLKFPNYLPKTSREILKKGFDIAKTRSGVQECERINQLILADKILRVDADEQLPP